MLTKNNIGCRKYYGKLHTASLPNEIRHIWYTKDKELSELPRHKWSWEYQTDFSSIDNADYLRKLLNISNLTHKENYALMMWCNGASMIDISESMKVSQARTGQMIGKALRKMRHYVKFLGRMDY